MRHCLILCVCLTLATGCRTVREYIGRGSKPATAEYVVSQETERVLQAAELDTQSAEDPGRTAQLLSEKFVQKPDRQLALAVAEMYFKAGTDAERRKAAECVDHYYNAAAYAYCSEFGGSIDDRLAGNASGPVGGSQAVGLYNQALERLIQQAQQYKKLDPQTSLQVQTAKGTLRVPVRHLGFIWQPSDFDELVVRDADAGAEGPYVRRGLGAPIAAVGKQRLLANPNEHLFPQHPFAATAILRPDLYALLGKTVPAGAAGASTATLELYDPLRISDVDVAGQRVPLRSDPSIPIGLALGKPVQKAIELAGFFSPEVGGVFAGLGMLEPYQPGKIPVVFVHGLLSGPSTWNDTLNAIRSRPDILERYQIWLYMYPTGSPFLESAEGFREELVAVRNSIDPGQSDPYLDQMVLVGHSMGGLLSKLQVTSSGDQLWDLVANSSIDELDTDDATKNALQRVFFFEPNPGIKRAVFMGTPHRGSSWSGNSVGRFGSKLVTLPNRLVDKHKDLVRSNPTAFKPLFSELPNSVDLLEPGKPLLTAMDKLPVGSGVKLHSIIGTNIPLPDGSIGDGIVPVSSAHFEGVESEFFVTATHNEVHKRSESVGELVRILNLHAKETAILLKNERQLVFR